MPHEKTVLHPLVIDIAKRQARTCVGLTAVSMGLWWMHHRKIVRQLDDFFEMVDDFETAEMKRQSIVKPAP